MSRADRLMQLADMLRGREATTVDELAHELAVSRRTVLRDLGTLRERGMPITGEAGHGGGVRLDGDRGLTPVHLSMEELVGLWLGARLSQAASDLPWGGGATTAMRKLLGALPLPRARQLRALTRRVVVGPPASEAVRASAGAAPHGLLAVLEVAFATGVGIAFQYTDREGRTTQRRVEPHGLCIEPPVWYILARDVEKDAARAFRMDRIAKPRSLPEVRFRPDLAAVTHDLPDRERWRPLSGAWD